MNSTTITLTENQQNILYWLTERQRELLLAVCGMDVFPTGATVVRALANKGLARCVSEKPRRWSLTEEGKLLASYLQTAGNVPSCDTNHPLTPFVSLFWALNKITHAKTIEQARGIATQALAEAHKDFEAAGRNAARLWATAITGGRIDG